ncbi:MAG: AraC family transcriptional regulator [Saprospiraceae bacterium]
MKFKFKRNKYGRELLIDCEKISEAENFTRDNTPFWIDFHEIFIVTSGSGVFLLDDENINFSKGTILLLPPNKWRQWKKIKGNLDGYFLIFEEEFMSNFFNDRLFLFRFHYFYNNAKPSFIQIAPNKFSDFLTRIMEVRKELGRLNTDSEHFLRAILYYILISINRYYQEQFDVKEEFFENNLTLRFRKLLEKEIRNFHDISYYADTLQVSKSHLNKTVKESLGRSTSQVIKERLLIEAKRSLLYSSSNVSEISYDLNFSEPANFNRFFKKMTSLTPKEYRLQNSK